MAGDPHSVVGAEAAGRPSDAPHPALLVIDVRDQVVAWDVGAAALFGGRSHDASQRLGDLLGVDPSTLSRSEEWHSESPLHGSEGGRSLAVSAYPLGGVGSGEGLLLLVLGESLLSLPKDQAMADWIMTSAPIAISLFGPGMQQARHNAAMQKLLEDFGVNWGNDGPIVAPLDPASVEWDARMRRALDTGVADRGFLLRMAPAGRRGYEHAFLASAWPLRDRNGRVAGLCTTLRDVTQERRSEERLAFLNEAATRIGSTLDLAHTGLELAELAVPRFADFVSLDLLEGMLSGDEPIRGPAEGAILRRVAHRSVRDGTPEAVVRVGEVDYYAANSLQARCLAHGKSELHQVTEDFVRMKGEEDPWRAAKDRAYGFHSWIVVPVMARGTTLGVADFVRTRNSEPFKAEDVLLAEDLVSRAAVCLDNARRFMRERATALTLQKSLLPQKLPDQSAVDAAFRYLPAAPELGVGGDWFDVIPLSGARVALVVGDVVGHGIQASATMGRLRAAVQTLSDVELAPDELLTHLDDLVLRLAEQGDSTTADVGATCLYATYDPVSGRCSMARAGHPAPLLVPPDGAAEVVNVPAGPPLGLGGLPFETVETVLPEGSLLALYTDGLVESRQRTIDDGVATLSRALTEGIAPLDTLCDRIVQALSTERVADDAALLLAKTQRLDTERIADWEVPSDPSAVAHARGQAAQRLLQWGLEELSFPAQLMISELVTNAIRYGRTPMELRLIRDRTLICEVSDSSSTAPHLRRARLFDEGGRGLMLVAQFAQRWGTRYTADGKVIWCELALPSDVSEQHQK